MLVGTIRLPTTEVRFVTKQYWRTLFAFAIFFGCFFINACAAQPERYSVAIANHGKEPVMDASFKYGVLESPKRSKIEPMLTGLSVNRDWPITSGAIVSWSTVDHASHTVGIDVVPILEAHPDMKSLYFLISENRVNVCVQGNELCSCVQPHPRPCKIYGPYE